MLRGLNPNLVVSVSQRAELSVQIGPLLLQGHHCTEPQRTMETCSRNIHMLIRGKVKKIIMILFN